ncbi:MAG: hypothetical protein NC311_12965 [Muribaculaceae bacterium]|nr:hypothetical protein [Muribaculaceae bacterium]MCM1532665.1 hypothetical protein [Ruminococcus flavefaciens]
MKFIFELFTSPLGLPIPWYIEYIILLAVNTVAFELAFAAVGKFYSGEIIHGRKSGSILHWIIRFFAFFVLWAILYGLISFIKLCIAHWVMVVSIIGALLAIVLAIFITVKVLKNR